MSNERKYLQSLKVGDRVVETGRSCMFAATGTVFMSETPGHGMCVRWDVLPGDKGQMSTSVTHGTQRIRDVLSDLEGTRSVLATALDLQEAADEMMHGIARALTTGHLDQRSMATDAYIIYRAKKDRLAKEAKIAGGS